MYDQTFKPLYIISALTQKFESIECREYSLQNIVRQDMRTDTNRNPAIHLDLVYNKYLNT